MTARRNGKRTISAEHKRNGKRQQGGRQTALGKREALAPKERKQLLQFVACGSIFVLLVTVKLLLPGKLSGFQEKLTGAMEQNMDVQAVFSAVGRAFSGEEDAARDVYQAVFRPEEETARKTAVLLPENAGALESLQRYRSGGELEGETAEPAESLESEGKEAAELAYILYSKENLPECVSLEQAILDFDYYTPVRGDISSKFGYREHPTAGEERFHYGVDLAAETGTDIACFADGIITAVGESSSYGKYCTVTHSGGYTTLYAHCSRITVSSGMEVKGGQTIAEVGETGMATGPHLHFELHQNNTYLNPIYYLDAM